MMNNKWISIVGACIFTVGLTACSVSTEKADSAVNPVTTPSVKVAPESLKDPIHLTKEKVVKEPQDPTIAALVNKEYGLDENYAPLDLVSLDVPTVLENPEVNQLRKEAADALSEMFNKAKESDIHLYARSGYRSYQTQVQLFNGYASKHGKEAANRFSAKPGHSEHQTGLGIDVTSESVDFQLVESFGETEEGKWIREHGHEFGFIIRYPQDKEAITGYIYEPWHIRYLGVELATKVYKSGLTYEEYLIEEEAENGEI